MYSMQAALEIDTKVRGVDKIIAYVWNHKNRENMTIAITSDIKSHTRWIRIHADDIIEMKYVNKRTLQAMISKYKCVSECNQSYWLIYGGIEIKARKTRLGFKKCICGKVHIDPTWVDYFEVKGERVLFCDSCFSTEEYFSSEDRFNPSDHVCTDDCLDYTCSDNEASFYFWGIKQYTCKKECLKFATMRTMPCDNCGDWFDTVIEEGNCSLRYQLCSKCNKEDQNNV